MARRSVSMIFAALLCLAAPLLAQQSSGAAQAPAAVEIPPEDEAADDAGEIIVTGAMRVRQGGAQDIRHFRAMSASIGLPRPESLTVEGLLGEHDLTLSSSRPCTQLFCLVAEAMPAALPTRPEDKLFVGLGFASNIDAASWRRDPVHLVAVVDKSGSMQGAPLDLVRRSLRQIVGQMRAEDRLSIVLYGDTSHLYLPPTEIGRGRSTALRAIDRIESAGSTNMEEGLEVGYATAFANQGKLAGQTRLMLFTDEQPNVGATDPASFMGMAQAASRRGVGLTTIGVGVQFDGALATKVSSVRGGNLFFIADPEQVKSVFAGEFDTMVSELAHDVTIAMTPQAGYRISGVYGVPDGLMTDGGDGAVTITVPTAFLSKNGGGIFATLARDSGRANLPPAALDPATPVMRVALSYVGAKTGEVGSDRVAVAAPAGAPSKPMRLGQLLVDEFLVLKNASTAYHTGGDPKAAYHLLKGLSGRLASSGLSGIGAETKLVGEMLEQAAFYSGYTGERPKSLKHLAVLGTWTVRNASGFVDLKSGDKLAFDDENVLVITRRSKTREEESEEYRVNAKQLYLPESRIVFDYSADGDTLVLRDEGGLARLDLKRVRDVPAT